MCHTVKKPSRCFKYSCLLHFLWHKLTRFFLITIIPQKWVDKKHDLFFLLSSNKAVLGGLSSSPILIKLHGAELLQGLNKGTGFTGTGVQSLWPRLRTGIMQVHHYLLLSQASELVCAISSHNTPVKSHPTDGERHKWVIFSIYSLLQRGKSRLCFERQC